MHDCAHGGGAGQDALREDIVRLESALERFDEELGAAHGRPGTELLVRTAQLLQDEIDRLRKLLA
jgi:hypothetical protein